MHCYGMQKMLNHLMEMILASYIITCCHQLYLQGFYTSYAV